MIDKLGVCVCDELGSPFGIERDFHSVLCEAELLDSASVSNVAN